MDRKYAAAYGSPTYDESKPCKMCGGTMRYTANTNCVPCSTNGNPLKRTGVERKTGNREEREANAEAWREAQRRGVAVYERISPCRKCADNGNPVSVLRYTSNGGCVACQKRRASQQYEERMAINQNAPHPVAAQACGCGHKEEIRALLPELNGQIVAYSRHLLFNHITDGRTHHYGKCVACHPSRAISMFNQMSDMKPLMPEYAYTWHILSRLMERTEDYPNGYLSECMKRHNMNRTGPQKPPTFTPEEEKGMKLDPKETPQTVIDWVNGVKPAPVPKMTPDELALLQAKSTQRFTPENLTPEQKKLLGIPDIRLP